MSGSDEADPLSPDGIAPAHSHRSASPTPCNEIGKSVDSPAQTVQNTDLSRVELNARLDRVLAHYHKIANASHPSIDLDAALDRTLKHSQRRPTLVHNEMTDGIVMPARRDQDAVLGRAHQVCARLDSLERSLTHFRRNTTPVHHDSDVPVPVSMAHTGEETLVNDQSSCPLFRLPPELRNMLYTYVVYSKYSLLQFQ